MNRLKKVWHDPVWGNVIAGLILLALTSSVTYFLDWWPAVGEVAQAIYRFALLSTPLPNWIIGVVGLFAVPTLLILLLLLWKPAFSQEPNWKENYTTDTFSNLRWRWSFFDDGEPYKLTTFCAQCDFQIYPQQVGAYGVDRIAFKCDLCGQRLAEFDESFDSLENNIKRRIQHKVRTQTWRVKDDTAS
jgi:hypothetical protein